MKHSYNVDVDLFATPSILGVPDAVVIFKVLDASTNLTTNVCPIVVVLGR